MAAQVTHAAGESSQGNLSPGTYAVVLQASQDELRALQRRLEDLSVPHRPIIESDPPYTGELMAIGLQPGPRKEVQQYVSSIKLLR